MDYFAPINNAMNAYVHQGQQNNDALLKAIAAKATYGEMLRKQEYNQGLRNYLAGATESVSNPDYMPYKTMQAGAYGPPVPQEDINAYAASNPQEVQGWRDSNAGLDTAQSALNAYGTAPEQTITRPMHPLKASLQYAMQHGTPEDIAAAQKGILEHSINLANVQGDEAAVNQYNALTGANLQYIGKKGDWSVTHDNKTGATYAFNSRTFDPKDPSKSFLQLSEGQDPEALLDKKAKIAEEAQARLFEQQRVLADINTQRTIAAIMAKDRVGGGKPLPQSIVKLQSEELNNIGLSSSISTDLKAIKAQIDKGDLKLGPIRNAKSAGLNYIGMSTEESRNFNTFKATLEKLRNDSLRLNKGVQTEGDAVRAWNEILSNINDDKLVSKRLDEVDRINKRAVLLRKENINATRAEYGKEPLDTSVFENLDSVINAPPAQQGAQQSGGYVVRVKGK